jgi:hypothetical protein
LVAAAITALGCQGTVTNSTSVAPDDDAGLGAEPPVNPRDAAPTRDGRDAVAAAADARSREAGAADARSPDTTAAADAAEDGADAGDGERAPYARGLQIGLVEIAQAVFIAIGDGATVVAPDRRNARLMEARAAFARVHVRPGAGFAPRALRAVLTLVYADGTRRELADEKMVSAASTTEKLESSFNFLLPAEAVKPEMRLAAAIYETGAGEGAEPAVPPRFPAEGAADLAVMAGPMLMEVVLLPVTGPSGPLDAAPERRRFLESYLADVYPVQKMTIRWHEPLPITSVISAATAFKLMQTTRKQDNAPAGAYYHLLIAAEDCSDKYLGLGTVAGPLPGDAPNRVAMTMVTEHRVDSQWDTVAHEMGHNLGRAHAPGCDAAGVDPGFPYANTGVGVDGYSVAEMAFKSRKKWKDVMGYCYPTWISDYTWNALATRVRIVTAFTTPRSLRAPLRSLQGYYRPGRKPEWVAVEGKLVAEDAVVTKRRWARLVRADGTSATVPIAVSLLRSPAGPEEGARVIAIDLPDADLARVEVSIDGERFVAIGPDLEP